MKGALPYETLTNDRSLEHPCLIERGPGHQLEADDIEPTGDGLVACQRNATTVRTIGAFADELTHHNPAWLL